MDLSVRVFGEQFHTAKEFLNIFSKELKENRGVELLSVEGQSIFVKEILDFEYFKKYPVCDTWRSSVSKMYIQKLDTTPSVEMNERILGIHLDSLSAPKESSSTFSHRFLFPTTQIHSSSKPFVLRVLSNRFQIVGLDVWPAGIFFCEFILSNPDEFSGSSGIFEIGSGIGMTGIFLRKYCKGIERIMMTDYKDVIIDNMKKNIVMNGLKDENIETSFFDVMKKVEEKAYSYSDFDTIVVADLFYDDELIISTIEKTKQLYEMMGCGGSRKVKVYVVATKRLDRTFRLLEEQIEKHFEGCVVSRLDYRCLKKEYFVGLRNRKDISIFKIVESSE